METQKNNINFYKLQAKKLKRELGISHVEALNQVAQKYKFPNWTACQRSFSKTQTTPKIDIIQITFSDWLRKQKNRDSPLGDLAREMVSDDSWPSHDDHESYDNYLYLRGASWQAVDTLKNAWKSYKNYLKLQLNPKQKRIGVKKTIVNRDPRKIVIVNNITPIHFRKRTVEKFNMGDKAWISWDNRKAIPVTITAVTQQHYTFKIERPIRKAGNEHYLFLDEVRSTPELACINRVTS